MRSLFLPSMIAALGAVGCAAEPPSVSSGSQGNPSTGVATPSKPPERVQKPTEPYVTGEAPQELIAKMRADLAEKVGASKAESARVMQSESVQWPDGSMGCPQPGMMYTQALVPGYRVKFQVGEETYSYHAAERGSFKLCTNEPRRLTPRPIKEP